MIDRDPELLRRYERDVSGLAALPDGVVRARDIDDVIQLTRECCGSGTALLPIGAQTSTTGASVAIGGGVILAMATLLKEPQIDVDRRRVIVAPGTNMASLQASLHGHGLELPVDPTSSGDCTIGGAIATNASGASTFRYGAMNRWVRAITLIDGRGERLEMRRSDVEKQAMGPVALRDPVAMIVGSEGIFGTIVQAELAVIERVRDRAAVIIGFGQRDQLVAAVKTLRALSAAQGVQIRAIEWLDSACCRLLREIDASFPLPTSDGGALYVDAEGAAGGVGRSAIDGLDVIVDCICGKEGSERAVALVSARDLRRFGALRHAVPETLNARGRRFQEQDGGGKLSTDWSVPIDALTGVLQWSDRRFAQLQLDGLFVYGHIGNGHPHFNLICKDAETKQLATAALSEQVKVVMANGGTPVSEHGIGKLKRDLVRPYLANATVAAITALKRHFDPANILARGNLL